MTDAAATMWGPIAPAQPPRRDRLFVALAPVGAAVACLLLVATGRLWAAGLLAATLFGVIQARILSPRFARALESTLARLAGAMAHAVGIALSWVLMTLVFVVIILPVSLVTMPFTGRRFGRGRSARGPGWVARDSDGTTPRPRRTYGSEPVRQAAPEPRREQQPPAPPARRARRRAPRTDRTWATRLGQVVTVVAVVMVLDLVAGTILTVSGIRPGSRGDTRRDIEAAVATTMAAPAILSEPWAEQYAIDLSAFELSEPQYVPYLVRSFREYQSEHINTTSHERLSYQPTASTETDPLRVAFFGGSTMFGVGQRDEHTIPSEFARLAEDGGVTVEVHNYGFPGWVAWQELQYLERLLAEGERYDMIVFYDGYNEFSVQTRGYSRHPTQNGASETGELAAEYYRQHETTPGLFDWAQDLGTAYRANSGVARILDPILGGDQNESVSAGESPERQADAALDIYGRSQRLITDLADDHDTPVRFLWQPQRAGWPTEITGRLPDTVTDISHSLDGQEDDVYIDEVHTNEEGARLLAAAMWEQLQDQLEGRTAPPAG